MGTANSNAMTAFFPHFCFSNEGVSHAVGGPTFCFWLDVCVCGTYIYIYEDVQGKLTIKIVRSLLLIYMVSGLSQCEFISHFTTYPSGNYWQNNVFFSSLLFWMWCVNKTIYNCHLIQTVIFTLGLLKLWQAKCLGQTEEVNFLETYFLMYHLLLASQKLTDLILLYRVKF